MKVGITYTYMGVEGTCWGYSQIEANSIKEAEHKANIENRNIENFKIQEIKIILEKELKTNKVNNIPNVIKDSTPITIHCRCCGKTFTKRMDEGASQCYECYKKQNVPDKI